MDSSTSATFGFLGLWMIFQLALVAVILLGGLYALYCLHRTASGVDRLAAIAEAWLNHQMHLEQQRSETEAQQEPLATVVSAPSETVPGADNPPLEWHRSSPPST